MLIEISECINYGYTIWSVDDLKFILHARNNKYFDDDDILTLLGEKEYEKLQKGKFQFNVTRKKIDSL